MGPRKQIAGAAVILAAAVAALILVAPRRSPAARNGLPVRARPGKADRYETVFQVMGTDGRLEAVAPDEAAARRMFEAALPQLRMVEQLMSTYRPDSDVSRLNQFGAQRPVALSEHMLAVMRKSVELSRLTGGAFDVTYAPLRTLWRRAQQEARMPDAEAVDEALAAVGWAKLVVEDDRVGFAVQGMEVDLGGIAKGYAVDLAAAALQETGASAGIVDIGGDLRLFGTPGAGGRWRIRIQQPPGVEEEWTLDLPACAVATSGDYARWFSIGDERLSHIVDPRTGRPVAGMASVTVTAPDAMTADALATALSVMGPEAGVKLVDSLPDVECMIVTADAAGSARTRMSAGFPPLLESP
ncbi:MAG: FAD:protein FMN transferase [Planctomycetota bacterium]|jgi:thiamine biosynthesis lipoprotein